ncbi:hypothetical protein VNO80_16126 [Phaseolus coccineus]|uniref:SKP1-like protein n=1 Tax=Phaseolus coccineus TaxID=3886 RepID=A0AAN9MLW4_PHACN
MGERGEEWEAVMLRKAEEEESKAVKKVKLVTSDGVTMEVEISTVKEMETIQAFMNATDTDNSIIFPLPKVSSHILSRIMELMSGEYDQELVKRLSHEELKEICMVANYLNMKTLLHLTASAIANLIQNKSVEFVRHFFNIINDFTPEEEVQLRKTHEWAFEGVDED